MNDKRWKLAVLILLAGNIAGAVGAAYMYHDRETGVEKRVDLIESWQKEQMRNHDVQVVRNMFQSELDEELAGKSPNKQNIERILDAMHKLEVEWHRTEEHNGNRITVPN